VTKTGKGGAGGFSARALAADYVKLCHHPTKDLKRWIAEDKKNGRAYRQQTITTKGEKHGQHAEKGTNDLAQAVRLRGEILHELCGGLDAHREGRFADRLPSRSRAGHTRHDRLRSLRAEGRAALLSSAANDNARSTNVRMQFRAARVQLAGSRAPPLGASTVPDVRPAGSFGGSNPGWPQPMKDELAGCKTPADYTAWAAKWGAVLGGMTGGAKPDKPPRPATVTRRTGEASGPT
jgi:hypothetical protein